MRLFEAIVEANHRAARGENAGLRPSEHAASLPVVALSCIDPRLNPLLPEVLGIPEEHFIWLRNAGNIITSSTSSTMRSIALACAVKGGREIAVIGHTDCKVRHTSAADLLAAFSALGVQRSQLPDNVNEFFGLFASERANVLKAVNFVRQSPLIGAAIPVHGLLVDVRTGQLEWLVNGYTAMTGMSAGSSVEKPSGWNLEPFHFSEMKFPDSKIGEATNAPELPIDRSAKPEPPPLKLRQEESIPIPPPIPSLQSKRRQWRSSGSDRV